MTASYAKHFYFIEFFEHFHKLLTSMSELLYLHQTFTDFVSNQYTHFGYVGMSDVTTSYERFSGYIGILKILMFDT